MLGISNYRVHELIRANRLPHQRVGRMYFIPIEAVEHYKSGPSGRARKQPPRWRVYRSGISASGTDIEVQVRSGQEKNALERFKAIYKAQRHTFTGTFARFVFEDETSPMIVSIWLVWKDTELPDEATRQQELAAFQAEFADVLDWDTAVIRQKRGIIYT